MKINVVLTREEVMKAVADYLHNNGIEDSTVIKMKAMGQSDTAQSTNYEFEVSNEADASA